MNAEDEVFCVDSESDTEMENLPTKTAAFTHTDIKTSQSEIALTRKDKLDEQLARFFFAANIAFHKIEHAQLKKFCEMACPGYSPPNEKILGGRLLDKIYNEEQQNCADSLNGESVNFSIDGWSNIRNNPIICANVTKDNGDVVLIETVDTSGKPHDADYLTDLSLKIIKNAETKYQCKVTSFVTDNAANMRKMRQNITEVTESDSSISLATYGCSAHILNLLAGDFGEFFSSIHQHVLLVIKYFRNKHLPKAWYHEAGGKALPMPCEVRWNTMCDSLAAYIKNWNAMAKVKFED